MAPKTLLLAGLGKNASSDPANTTQFNSPTSIKAAVAAEMQTLTAQGYTCVNVDLNPNDIVDTLSRLKETFQQQRFDGFVIGFGLRGNKEYTDLFEKVVNLGIKMNGRIRFGFSTSPTGLVETVGRIFPEGVMREEGAREERRREQ